MSRMWSQTDRFNEAWQTLTPSEKGAGRALIDGGREAVALRVGALEADGRVKRAVLLLHTPNVSAHYNGALRTIDFRDDIGSEILIGVPPFTYEVPVEEAQTQVGTVGSTNDGFGFSAALICLKDGDAVARRGWNASGQFVCMMPALHLPPFNTQDTSHKVNDRTAKWIGEDQPLDCQPYFALYNAQKKWQPGWVPSTGDLLAEDWFLFEIKYD